MFRDGIVGRRGSIPYGQAITAVRGMNTLHRPPGKPAHQLTNQPTIEKRARVLVLVSCNHM